MHASNRFWVPVHRGVLRVEWCTAENHDPNIPKGQDNVNATTLNQCTGRRFMASTQHNVSYCDHLKILGWSSGFRAIDKLPRAHWDETEFSIPVFHLNRKVIQRKSGKLFKDEQGRICLFSFFFFFFCFFFFSFLVSNADTNRVILFYEKWQVCNVSVLRCFAVATVYFSHYTSVTTLFLGRFSRLIG